MDHQNIKVAVDAVVFGYREEKMYGLFIKPKYGRFKDKWALPGGFVRDDETLDQAVKRELKEETGITVDYLEQLYTFGKVDRDPRGRVISVSYFALVNPRHFTLRPTTDAAEAQWFELNKLPALAYDHRKIFSTAHQRLQNKVHYQPIGFDLLNKTFPFSDLEKLYMAILDRAIDRRNFRKKMLSFGILKETGQSIKQGSGRPAALYSFDKQRYQELTQKGFHFEVKIPDMGK